MWFGVGLAEELPSAPQRRVAAGEVLCALSLSSPAPGLPSSQEV